MNTAWASVQNSTNEKFYIIGHELQDLRAAQNNIIQVQQANAATLQTQFAVLEESINYMRNCDQFLYIREETNYHANLLNSVLSVIYTNLRTYRASLHSFRMTLLGSSSTMADGFLPLTLIPRQILQDVLHQVLLQATPAHHQSSFSIPIENLMSYYETKLVSQVVSTDFGLLFTLLIPFSSESTVLDLFHAIPIPMPPDDSLTATVWEIETEYIAVAKSGHEAALLTRFDLNECIGSKSYSICFSSFPMEKAMDSCLATLFYKDVLAALEVCQIKTITLPLEEKAQYLGIGRWLILSASPSFLFTESNSLSSPPMSVNHRPGCQVCIIVLQCGQELQGPNIHLRSDWSTCVDAVPLQLDIQLPDPLAFLFNELPPTADLAQIPDIDTARVKLVSEVQTKLLEVPQHKRRQLDVLAEVAKPIAANMKTLPPPLAAKFHDTVSWTPYICFGALVFIVSTVLHFLMTYLFHKTLHVHRRFPFRLNIADRTIEAQPILIVSPDDFDYLQTHLDHPIHKKGIVLTRNDLPPCQLTQPPTAPLFTVSDPTSSIYPNFIKETTA